MRGYRAKMPIWRDSAMTSKSVSQRPQKTSAHSHYNWLMDVARWCGIHWEISSMHTTAENAIMVAADQKDEIERLRAALQGVRRNLLDGELPDRLAINQARAFVDMALRGESETIPNVSGEKR